MTKRKRRRTPADRAFDDVTTILDMLMIRLQAGGWAFVDRFFNELEPAKLQTLTEIATLSKAAMPNEEERKLAEFSPSNNTLSN